MTFTVSDYVVKVGTEGDILCIYGPHGMNIPPDPANSRYQDFLLVDTEKKLCVRQTIPEPVKSTSPTLEDRLAALEAGQKTIAAKVGVTLVSEETI
jgi:hypothetical protein